MLIHLFVLNVWLNVRFMQVGLQQIVISRKENNPGIILLLHICTCLLLAFLIIRSQSCDWHDCISYFVISLLKIWIHDHIHSWITFTSRFLHCNSWKPRAPRGCGVCPQHHLSCGELSPEAWLHHLLPQWQGDTWTLTTLVWVLYKIPFSAEKANRFFLKGKCVKCILVTNNLFPHDTILILTIYYFSKSILTRGPTNCKYQDHIKNCLWGFISNMQSAGK